MLLNGPQTFHELYRSGQCPIYKINSYVIQLKLWKEKTDIIEIVSQCASILIKTSGFHLNVYRSEFRTFFTFFFFFFFPVMLDNIDFKISSQINIIYIVNLYLPWRTSTLSFVELGHMSNSITLTPFRSACMIGTSLQSLLSWFPVRYELWPVNMK